MKKFKAITVAVLLVAGAAYAANGMLSSFSKDNPATKKSENSLPRRTSTVALDYEDWASTNHADGSSSSCTWTVSTSGGTFSFDYSVSSEGGCDILRVYLNDAEIVSVSGEESGTYTTDLEMGEYTLVARYSKDGSVSSGSDMATVTNISAVISAEDMQIKIQGQVSVADSILANLAYANVPGSSELKVLADSARSIESLSDEEIESAHQLVADIKAMIANVDNLDRTYSRLNLVADSTLQVGTDNEYVNSELLTQATAYVAELKDGLSSGAYGTSELDAAFATLSRLSTRLGLLYISVDVTIPGTLGDSILAKVENFTDVTSIKLSGMLNDDDVSNIQNRLSQLREIDMSDVRMTYLPVRFFYERRLIEYVELPAQLTSIGEYAFYGCYGLKHIDFPPTLQTISRYAFSECDNLEEVILPEELVTMGEGAFYSCDNNKYLKLPGTLTSISYAAFYYNWRLTQVDFAEGLQAIGNTAFGECHALENLKFPSTLYSIGSNAFYSCYNLSNIILNEGLTSIGDLAFYHCDALTEITLPSTLQTLNGYYAFRDCDNLTQVTCNNIVPPYVSNNNFTGKSGLDLYVPQLSVNVYKQTSGWDQFNIHGIDVMPENIVIQSNYNLNWPDSLSMDYKPNVDIWYNGYTYGSLSVNGNSTLSARQFSMVYDPNIDMQRGDYWDGNRYRYYRTSYAALVNNATVRADNVTISLWPRANSWDFLSLPFDIKVSDIRLAFEGTPFVIRKYDGQKRADGLTGETWVDMTADSILHAGEGYIWRSASTDGNRNYTGFYLDALQTVNKNNIFANDDIEVALNYYESEFEHNRSWNFIGNPYPCYYDIRAMQTSAPITVWDKYTSSYEAYSPQDDAYILNPGQAFFVQRPVDEESIIFLKEGRQTDINVRDIEYNNNARARAPKVHRSVFNLHLTTTNGQSDRTRFVINPAANLQYESARDASKFQSIEQPAVQLYTIEDGIQFAINERPMADGLVALGMQIVEDGTYTLKLDTSADEEVWLIDNQTGSEVLLSGSEGYAFSSKAGTFNNRFRIRIANEEITGIAGIEAESTKSESPVYDLQGRRTKAEHKGIYIKNGQKLLVK